MLILLLLVVNGIAQNIQVQGIVTDDNEQPLIGVNIQTREGSLGTVSDIDGKFSLSVPQNSKLIFSYVGFLSKEVNAVNSGVLNVSLTPINQELDEVVVVGYGSMKKRDITGAISSLNSEMIQQNAPIDIASALQGRIAGFEVMSNSGEPGSGSRMRIRGTSTLTQDGASPLFIVDGIEVSDIEAINPNDISSIEVLKDAASAAIYGSRSANGVVLITTHSIKNEMQKPEINVSYSYKLSQLAHKMPQMNRLDGLNYIQIREYFMGVEDYSIVQDSLAPNRLYDYDYQDILFRTAPTHNIYASVSGGNTKLSYFSSLSLYDNEGIMLNTFNKRIAARSNVDYQMTDKLKIGSRISFSNRKIKPSSYAARTYLKRPADYQMVEADGSYSSVMNNRHNPLAVLMLSDEKKDNYDINYNNYLEYKFIEGLTFRSSISANAFLNEYHAFYPAVLSRLTPQVRTSVDQKHMTTSWTFDNVLTYQKIINGHSISVMGGIALQSVNYRQVSLSVLGQPVDAAPISIGYSEVNQNGTRATDTSYRLASYFSRLSYSYQGKYLFNTNIRADGSSRFGQDNRWGNFPSVSVGWRFSDESFMDWTYPSLTDGKLRISYGRTGNQTAGNFASRSLYTSVYYGDYTGLQPSQLANDNLGWEKTRQYNAGIDLNFFKGRLMLTFDYYDKETSDVLYAARLPQTTGFSSSYKNIGSIRNNGFEVSINTENIKTKHFTWNTQLNLAKNKNVISSLAGGEQMLIDDLYIVDEGYAIGTIYGYKKLAIFSYDESNAFTPDGKQLTPVFDERERFVKHTLDGQDYNGEIKQLRYNSATGDVFKGGDVMWHDKNGDFVIDVNDKQKIGNAQPFLVGGFTNNFFYKQFALSMFFNFSIGGDIFNQTEYDRSNHIWSGITKANPLNVYQSWLAPGDIAKYPKPDGSSVVQNTRRESSMWVEDGSYIKLKNIRLRYRFPRSITSKMKIERLEVFVQLKDFFVWTNYTGQDPELGEGNVFVLGYDNNSYPRSKDMEFGINMKF